MDHPSCSKRHSVSIVSSNNRYYDADVLSVFIQLAQLIVPGNVFLKPLSLCDCVHSDDGKVDRLQSAMAKRVMRTRRMPVFCEIASVKLQAYFTMCFSFVVVYPLDLLGKPGRFPRKNRSFNGFIVQ